MNGYDFVDMSSKLSLLNVNSFNPFIVTSRMDIDIQAEEETRDYSTVNTSKGSNHRDNLKEIGETGERIAEAYLKTIYKPEKVERVGHNERLGYDIKAGIFLYEIKTCTSGSNSFYISINELKTAFEHKLTHKLIFIKYNKERVYGYEIVDMFKIFDITWLDIKNTIEKEDVSITATNFRFEMDDNFLKQLKKIDLTEFASY